MIDRVMAARSLMRGFALLLLVWILTLGVFVETTVDSSFQDEKKIDSDTTISVAVTRAGILDFGCPYVFFKRTDVGPFGIAILISSGAPIDSVQITEVVIDGQVIDTSMSTLSSFENRNYFFKLPACVNDSQTLDINLSGRVTSSSQFLDFHTYHLVENRQNTRFATGWMMLLYFAEF